MKITSINIKPVQNSERLAARVSLTIDNAISVRGIRLWRGDEGYSVSMPTRLRHNEPADICKLLTPECRQYVLDAVVSAYEAAKAEGSDEDSYIYDMEAMEPGEKLNITDFKVQLNDREGSRVKAFAEITIDGMVTLTDMVIVEREDKPLLLGMPNMRRYKRADGTLSDAINVYHPISAEHRANLSDLILGEYDKMVAEQPQ